MVTPSSSLAKEVARRAVVVSNPARDLAGLADSIGRARIVMLGEASHGTHEFYQWRQAISELLIAQHGFRALAVEGDWPSCHQVSRFLCDRTSSGAGLSAQQVLVSSFRRWPPWMWANHEFEGMLEWIKDFNLRQEEAEDEQVKLYGLDVYSLFESIATAVEEIEKLDPVLAENARRHYACYYKDEYRQSDLPEGFQSGAELVFKELTSSRWRSQIQNSSRELEDTIFNATQNARIAKNSECFFRAMGQQGQGGSWEVRERHMMETLDEILNRKPGTKLIVWAHNTQIGDYRATPMYVIGQKNLGGMAKEKYGQDEVALVGFGTFEGSVAASSKWSGHLEIMPVPPAMEGSYEHALYQANIPGGNFYLMLKDAASSRNHPLLEWRGNRGIGIVYDPSKERLLNYIPCMLAKRYDAFVFITSTKGLEPLEISSHSPMSISPKQQTIRTRCEM